MTERFLGEDISFWIGVRTAMRKANIHSVEALEARLDVVQPTCMVKEENGRFEVIERTFVLGHVRVVGWGATREDADRIKMAIERAK